MNIKKGQFLSPWEMQNVVDKARSTGNQDIMVCERGFSFGYNNLVSDMRSLAVMRGTGCPVVFDATHSVQLPGGKGSASGGQREFIPVLARSADGGRCGGLFMETHPDPATALSDGPNAWPLDKMQPCSRRSGVSTEWSSRTGIWKRTTASAFEPGDEPPTPRFAIALWPEAGRHYFRSHQLLEPS